MEVDIFAGMVLFTEGVNISTDVSACARTMQELRLQAERLELVACTQSLLAQESHDLTGLALLLNADIPAGWPPPLNDEASRKWAHDFLALHADAVGWSTWYFILKKSRSGKRTLIANGGFKGMPLPDGTVEIGYSVMEDYQRNGYATEAVARLLKWAFLHPEVTRVIAETYPHIRASIRVLEKCGFQYVGEGSELLVIRFELTRHEHERQ